MSSSEYTPTTEQRDAIEDALLDYGMEREDADHSRLVKPDFEGAVDRIVAVLDEARREGLAQGWDEAVARAEKAEREPTTVQWDADRTAPARTVTHADVEKALDTGIRGATDGGLIDQDTSIPSGECVRLAVDAVCNLLGIEAEPVDPVEQKAVELFEATDDNIWAWATAPVQAQDRYRRIAEHVLGQEANNE